jgi:hypothetical protein
MRFGLLSGCAVSHSSTESIALESNKQTVSPLKTLALKDKTFKNKKEMKS